MSEKREAKIHYVKCWPEYFQAMFENRKRFELRVNDRDYQEGDVVIQQEWNPETEEYTGREFEHGIGFVFYGKNMAWGLDANMCIFSVVAPIPDNEIIKELEAENTTLQNEIAELRREIAGYEFLSEGKDGIFELMMKVIANFDDSDYQQGKKDGLRTALGFLGSDIDQCNSDRPAHPRYKGETDTESEGE